MSIVCTQWRHVALKLLYTARTLAWDDEVEHLLGITRKYALEGSVRYLKVQYSHPEPDTGSLSSECTAGLRQIVLLGTNDDTRMATFIATLKTLQACDLHGRPVLFMYKRTCSLVALAKSALRLLRLRISWAILNPEVIDLQSSPSFCLTSLHLHKCAITGPCFAWLLGNQTQYVHSHIERQSADIRDRLRNLGLSWLNGLHREDFVNTVVPVVSQLEVLCLALEPQLYTLPVYQLMPWERYGTLPDEDLLSLSSCSGVILSACPRLKALYYDDTAGKVQDLLQLQELEILHVFDDHDEYVPNLDCLWTNGRKQLSALRKLVIHSSSRAHRFTPRYRYLAEDFGIDVEFHSMGTPETFMLEYDPMPMPSV